MQPGLVPILFAPRFNPLSLFAGGVGGIWYDPSDLSTLFQDDGGTIPVTADGDPVGLILDKSGNGKHASQVTAGLRPFYKTAGGLKWLLFDGTDDTMLNAPPAADVAICAAVRPGVLSSYRGIFATVSGSPGASMFANLASGKWGTYSGSDRSANSTLASGADYVLTMEGLATGLYRLNGVSDGTYAATGGQGVPHFGGEITQEFPGRIYGMIARAALFGTKLRLVERYLAKKAGMSL